MSAHAEPYLAILKASYNYNPQSDDEIPLKEDQLLFLIERIDDDWWRVKIKGDTQDDDSPVGLVPAAYVEQADHTSIVKTLYDYEAAAPGELSVQEDEVLLVFDTEQDWLLVQSRKEGGKAGFVPGNYVEAYAEGESLPAPRVIVPPPAQRPISTYVDPADRVAATKANADGIQTWSVSELDKKGKKKKGTLGIGNGALFFASEADKNPVQKWRTQDVNSVSSEKAKHIIIEIGGATPLSLHFLTGSKENVDAIMTKLDTSKALSSASIPRDSFDNTVGQQSDVGPGKRETTKPSVHFSDSSPEIIPTTNGDDDDDDDNEKSPAFDDSRESLYEGESASETGIALYDFTADGDDELSIVEGERLIIIERDGDEWWKCQNSEGATGVVPASYIEIPEASLTLGSQSMPQDQDASEEEEEERVRLEEQRLSQQQEQERQRARAQELETHKKVEAQKRAKEAAAAAETESKKRKEALAKRSSTPPVDIKKAVPENQPGLSRTSMENNRPPADRTRVWHDRTGQFRVEAAFLGISNGKLRLHKVNGVVVEVPSEKMSLEDLQFVERMTSKNSQPSVPKHMSDDDIPLALARPTISSPNLARSTLKKKTSHIDWFDFFLSAGCDIDDCTRYASSFEKDKIDETILSDITESTMRSLGVREGDIIRITKAIEKRNPSDNLNKPVLHAEEQIRRDEEFARQLQAQESGGSRSPAPNLFAGPGGMLKNPRRGRPQPSKSLPPTTVDINAISTASENLQRTSSPQILTPNSAYPSSSPVQGPPRSGSTVLPVSGFGDDAWTNRPSSTKPLVGTPAPRAPSVPPVTTDTMTPAAAAIPVPASLPQVIPSPAPASSSSASTTPVPLAKTRESDIFDQLSRLSDLRKQTPAAQPPPSTSPPVIPPSYQAGLGMGSSPSPIAQLLQNLQINPPSQQSPQTYNIPRGPFAPVPANQSLLQPLIPTQTGFNSFVPSRPAPISPFHNPPQPSYPVSQPIGILGTQPLMSQPTGIPFNGFNAVQNTSPYTPIQSQYTGFNPNFAQSPFNNGAPSPPPLPVSPSSSTKDTSPANVFAQMKSGTFANENATTIQPTLTTHATSWAQPYQGGVYGYQR